MTNFSCIAFLNRHAYSYAVLASVEALMLSDGSGKTGRATPDSPDTAELAAGEACAPLDKRTAMTRAAIANHVGSD